MLNMLNLCHSSFSAPREAEASASQSQVRSRALIRSESEPPKEFERIEPGCANWAGFHQVSSPFWASFQGFLLTSDHISALNTSGKRFFKPGAWRIRHVHCLKRPRVSFKRSLGRTDAAAPRSADAAGSPKGAHAGQNNDRQWRRNKAGNGNWNV